MATPIAEPIALPDSVASPDATTTWLAFAALSEARYEANPSVTRLDVAAEADAAACASTAAVTTFATVAAHSPVAVPAQAAVSTEADDTMVPPARLAETNTLPPVAAVAEASPSIDAEPTATVTDELSTLAVAASDADSATTDAHDE